MIFKILMSMIGVTSTLLLIRDIRQKAQLKRIYKEIKLLKYGKETNETENKEADKTGETTDTRSGNESPSHST